MTDNDNSTSYIDPPPGTSTSRSNTTDIAAQVFGLFKEYLSTQLDEKDKLSEEKAKSVKEASEIKFKGNRKQFELNSKLDEKFALIERNEDLTEIRNIATEGRELIKRRQKLIKLADKSKDGWLVVQEYESDDLASNSEDDKKIRKAKNNVERKRKDAKDGKSSYKRFKPSNDNQLFRGKVTYIICMCSPFNSYITRFTL